VGSTIILPSFVLPDFKNQKCFESGIDSLDQCHNKKYFLNFPWSVEYQSNSRGYRDEEWPNKLVSLESSTWCIGDSFTVGIGSPVTHTWPNILSNAINNRTINISMDGASNNWISRKVSELITEVLPKNIVIHWSYLHRREGGWDQVDHQWNLLYSQIKDASWPICDRLSNFFHLPYCIQQEIIHNHTVDSKFLHFISAPPGQLRYMFDVERRQHYDRNLNGQEDFKNTISCIDSVINIAQSTGINIIHSFIPNFADQPTSIKIQQYLREKNICYIEPFSVLDYARDHHHYDYKISSYFVSEICKKLVRSY